MEYIASISYGKDSCTIPHVCLEVLKLPLTKLVTVDVMFNDDTSAYYPEVEEFKHKADEIFLKRYGLQVEHIKADLTYEERFFQVRGDKAKKNKGKIYGFPIVRGAWCNSDLKMQAINKYKAKHKDDFWYVGYALDEKKPERQEKIANCTDLNMYPLVKVKYTEKMCLEWCGNNGLLNPIYGKFSMDGCWFCHYQTLDQLRDLRHNHPDKWKMMLNLDLYSPLSFRTDGTTIHDLEKRFALEDAQMNIFDFIGDKK